MKKIIVAFSFCLSSAATFAQGYVGAVAALTSIGLDCSGQTNCDKRGFGVKFYAGSKLSASNQIDLGIGKVDAVEVGVINFGKASSQFTAGYTYEDPVLGLTPATRVVHQVATANALTAAVVLNAPVTTDFALSARLGGAYVSSTVKKYVEGAGDGSVTSTKLKPYVGFSASYNIVDSIKLIGSYDATRYDVLGHQSWLSLLGLGAEMSF